MSDRTSPVPFLDLAALHAEVRTELDQAWATIIETGRFIGGPEVEAFEAEFAAYCEAEHCIAVGNGTDALELILAALGIGPGDEVIVPTNTFVATAEAVCAVGAEPRFVDVRPDTLLIDPDAVTDAISTRTAAIMGVHLYGQMVDVPALQAIAERHSLAFIEDAAQAHGARFDGKRAGSVGVGAGFSFYPGKNLGALGDGGAVVTNDAALTARIRCLTDHGRSATERHQHALRGRNSRLDSLHAAALRIKLRTLDAGNARRREVMAIYEQGLPEGCRPVVTDPRAEPVHHLAIVQVHQRARVIEALDAAQIGWGLHYPVPCHQQPAFEAFGGSLPVAEAAADHILSLPMSPTLTDDQATRVCDVMQHIFGA